MKINWGTGIAIFLTVYMAGIIGVVIFSFQEDVNLVSKDYYQQELKYEDQIQRIRNTNKLAAQPDLVFNRSTGTVLITFPGDLLPDNGTVLFFRPSDFTKDKKYQLKLSNENTQSFDFAHMDTGMWKVKLAWDSGEQAYYKEFVIVK
jgi:hypothetical protein